MERKCPTPRPLTVQDSGSWERKSAPGPDALHEPLPNRIPSQQPRIPPTGNPACPHLVHIAVGGGQQLDLVVVVDKVGALGAQPEERRERNVMARMKGARRQ